MAIDSEPKRWAMHARAVGGPAIRNTVFNPDTSGLVAIERATVLRFGGTVAFASPTAIVGGGGQLYLFEWVWDRFGI